jgi:gliding motility-associated-like protein
MSQDNSHFEDVFRKALQNHETPVSPKVWAGVQSSLASGAGTATGSAILGKAAAVIGFTALITAATISEVQHAKSHTPKAVTETEATTTSSEITESAKYEVEDFAVNTIEEQADQTSTETEQAEQAKASSQKVPVTISEIADAKELNNNAKNSTSSLEKSENNHPQTAVSASEAEANKSPEIAEKTTGLSAKEAVKAPEPKVVLNETKTDDKPVVAKTTAYFTHPAESIFTPNGDGFHDQFEVEGHGVQNFNIRIMNRSGNVVFESTDINFKWNGNNRFGEPSPSGVYFFVIEAVGQDGLPYLEPNAKGSVTLKR